MATVNEYYGIKNVVFLLLETVTRKKELFFSILTGSLVDLFIVEPL